MIYFKHIITSFLLLISISLNVYASGIVQLVPLFKQGNSQAISQFFDTQVDISIKDKTGIYSSAQATSILSDFFAANRPIDFTLSHKGASNGGEFAIALLNTSAGNYKVSIFAKTIGGRLVIQQLRFEGE